MFAYRFSREDVMVTEALARAAESIGLAREIRETMAEIAACGCRWRGKNTR